jgi:hypothetical protein
MMFDLNWLVRLDSFFSLLGSALAWCLGLLAFGYLCFCLFGLWGENR